MLLTVGADLVELEPKPMDLLRTFLQRPGEVLTKEELLDHVWPEQTTTEGVLSNAISKLRKALGSELSDAIVTHSGIGYRLAYPVERTATGQLLTSQFSFEPGQAVPQRPHFILKTLISGGGSREVWIAENARTSEKRVYKFARDAAGLNSLKRETTIYKLVSSVYPDRHGYARLIDWSFEADPFFIESEYGGPDLKAWAEHDGQLASLSQAERLALVVHIVDSMAAAHSIGVLHKDLKPSNILIREQAGSNLQPVIIDFGSGGIFDRTKLEAAGVISTGLTQSSESAGFGGSTSIYAAPELLQGQSPSAASDVYSLGVMLYQLVTAQLEKPLATGWEQDIEDELLCQDIADATHGDLSRRIASAETLARRLHELPTRRERQRIDAKKDKALSEANAKLARSQARRPWIIAAVVSLASGIAISTNLYIQANAARSEAEQRADEVQASRDFLKEVLLSADPRTPGAGADASVREALERADNLIAARYERDPVIAAIIAGTLAEIQTGLSDFVAAIEAREREAQALEAQFGLTAPPTLIARYKQALALVSAGDYDQAEALLDEIDADTGPFDEAPPEVAMQGALVRGRLHLIRFDFAAASDRFDQAEDLYHRAGMEDLTLLHLINLDRGQCYSRLGRAKDAVMLLEKMTVAPYDDPAIVPKWRQARAKLFYGAALGFAGRHDEAEQVLLALVDEMSTIYGPDKVQVAEVQTTLARAYAATGRWEGAMESHSEARKIFCAELGDDHLACIGTRGNEGRVQLQLGFHDEAAGNLRISRAGLKAHTGENSPAVQVIGYHLATALIETGGYDEAESILQSLDIDNLEAGAPGNAWAALLEGSRARIDVRIGDRDTALPKLENAIADMRAQGVDNSMIAPFERDLQ